jgi:hypothetical protein
METSDGRTVLGLVKEKDQAREQYEQALRAGQFAGLINYVTDDSQSRCQPSIASTDPFSFYIVHWCS